MIAVLSWLAPRLENALTERGQQVVAIIPEAIRATRAASTPEYPLFSIDNWDNYQELTRLAGDLEALGVTDVVTLDEACVLAAAFLRGLLGLPGQTFESAVACTDKSVMKRRLAAAGIPTAEHRVVRSVAEIGAFLDEVGADIIVKPRSGYGAVNTHRVNRDNFDRLVSDGAFDPPQDMPDHYRSMSVTRSIDQIGFVAERFVEVMVEYHCELLRHEGVEVHCLAARYLNPLLGDITSLGGVFVDPESAEASAVRELTRAAATVLGVTHGFGHCEVFRDRYGRWLVGEFAARPGAGEIPRVLQLNYGISNPAMMVDLIAGRQPFSATIPSVPGSVAWVSIPVVGSGVIGEMPSETDFLALPGVIEANVVMRSGDSIGSLCSTEVYAAYLLCRGATPEHAEKLARRAKDACRVVAESPAGQPSVRSLITA